LIVFGASGFSGKGENTVLLSGQVLTAPERRNTEKVLLQLGGKGIRGGWYT